MNDASGQPLVDIWHVALPVADLERSLSFYCQVLGFTLLGRDEQATKSQAFIVVRPGGFCLELFVPRGRDAGKPRRMPDHLAFECRSLDEVHRRLQQAGHPEVPEVMTFSSGVRYLALRDPDGLEIEMFEGRAIYEASLRP